MAQTSIHICPVKGGSELHNERRKELDYVRKDLTPQNQTWKSKKSPSIDKQHAAIAADYLAAHGKKLHANATPIREAVVVIQKDTTMQQLLTACTKCKEKYGIEAMQIFTHKDEGHTAEDGEWKPNLHAHIVFSWYDFGTHTTCKLSRQDMSEMQTLFAECLNMERGVSSDRKHLNAIQQKNQAEAAKLQALQEKVLEQTEQHKEELLQECKDLRKSGRETVRAFDYLCGLDAVKPTESHLESRHNLEQECRKDLPAEVEALNEHARVLRINLMNTIKAVTVLGKKLQKIASRIPLLKRRRLSHEAELENTAVEALKAKAAAEEAKNTALAQQQQAEAARNAAEEALKTAQEDEARRWRQKNKMLQDEIAAFPQQLEEARQYGIQIGGIALEGSLQSYKLQIKEINKQLRDSQILCDQYKRENHKLKQQLKPKNNVKIGT